MTQRTVFGVRLELLDKGANVAKWLARLDLHADIGRRMGDADAELEAAADWWLTILAEGEEVNRELWRALIIRAHPT